MSSKTITVTEDAYEALKYMKSPSESFSEAILRIAKRKPLSSFYGILSKESGKKIEKAILENRKIHGRLQGERLKRISEGLRK